MRSFRTFRCRDLLWEEIVAIALEDETSPDDAINEAMIAYAMLTLRRRLHTSAILRTVPQVSRTG